jgi:hypothetical protein
MDSRSAGCAPHGSTFRSRRPPEIGSEESLMSTLFGSGEPFDTATLGRLYPGGSAEYLSRFTRALDQAIEAGFIVPVDRPEILELAAATFRE